MHRITLANRAWLKTNFNDMMSVAVLGIYFIYTLEWRKDVYEGMSSGTVNSVE